MSAINLIARLALLSGLSLMLSSCLMTGVSAVDSDPEFDWNTIKRDQILMTPLVDLRPANQRQDEFFTDKQRLAYPEAFKQTFFKMRKDIRVFGAGGAFDAMAQLPQFDDLARRVFAKEPLPADVLDKIRTDNQDIRFLFFFAITNETTKHEYQYVFRKDQRRDVKIYRATRAFDARLALWDSQTNKTVWIATERLTPSNENRMEVDNPTKKLVKQGKSQVWTGFTPQTSFASEFANNRSRFPGFPGREPDFSNSFDDFALALPIHPSEEKLIEYSYFTYHRPELGLRATSIGGLVMGLQLGSSSILNNRYRMGGVLILPLAFSRVKHHGDEYDMGLMAYGLTFDREWTLSNDFRLLTGVLLGGAVLTYELQEPETPVVEVGEEDTAEADGAFIAWPRVQLLFGEREGFQWGLGVAYHFYDGIEEPVTKAFRPAPWGVDASVAYTIRGF